MLACPAVARPAMGRAAGQEPDGCSARVPLPAEARQASGDPTAPVEGARFGEAVALGGGLGLVGAPRALGGSHREGGAQLARLDGASWVPLGWLAAAAPAPGERLGAAVALGSAGDWAALGAPLGAGSAGHSGVVRVFEPVGVGGTWVPTTDLCPAAVPNLSAFGARLVGDGPRLAVGAPMWPEAGWPQVGGVTVHERRPGGWVEVATVRPPDGRPMARAGDALALAGRILAVGAPRHDGRGPEAGVVWVHDLDDPGAAPARLDPPPGGVRPGFGSAVAWLPGGGSTKALAVGAPGPASGTLAPGAVHLFVHDGATWRRVGTLAAPPGCRRFGATLARDGDALWIGAPGSAGAGGVPGAGALCRVDLGGAWRAGDLPAAEVARVGDPGEGLGEALAAAGGRALVGAPRDDRGCGPDPTGPADCDAGGAWLEVDRTDLERACEGDGELELGGCATDDRHVLHGRVRGLAPLASFRVRVGVPGGPGPFPAAPAPGCGLLAPHPVPLVVGRADAAGRAAFALPAVPLTTLLAQLPGGDALGLQLVHDAAGVAVLGDGWWLRPR